MFGVCVVLVLSAIRCSFYCFRDRILFHHDFYHDSWYHYWDFLWPFITFCPTLLDFLSNSDSVNAQLPKCFRPWTFALNIGLNLLPSDSLSHVYITYQDILQGVPGLGTDCPYGVWCRWLATCLLYVGPLFGNLVENDSRLGWCWHKGKQPFLFFFIVSHLNAP